MISEWVVSGRSALGRIRTYAADVANGWKADITGERHRQWYRYEVTTPLDKETAISRLELTRCLLRAAGRSDVAEGLRDDQPVFPLDDGAMGSFALVPSPSRRKAASEADYEDEDGVGVLITLFVDDHDQALEVDFWKHDFAPLMSFPSQNQLKAVRAVS